MSNRLEIEIVPIGSVKPYENSARVHNARQLRKLVTGMTRFGQVTPIIVDENHVIVDGHAVWDALKKLGHTEIQVVVVRARSPAEIRAIRLALNRIAEDASWDRDKLRTEFGELIDLGIELDLTGFDTPEIDMTLSFDEPAGDAIEEVAASDLNPKAAVATAVGDIW